MRLRKQPHSVTGSENPVTGVAGLVDRENTWL
jgi:hypothetical protein